ncbi:unnamed protein product [Phytophthora fragariaefolia]|uniref:Unnamed protein product n=1 Tax=Phytophthora fragariaefolia TaxID=1490495 RepID=A0A9W7CSS7_9STRA|nr:unnamed protein product [Phytophthora fragariaefolia]
MTAQLRPTGSGEVQSIGETNLSEQDTRENAEEGGNYALDTELLEAYISYCRSIGHEPNIQLDPNAISLNKALNPQDSGVTLDNVGAGQTTYAQDRAMLPQHHHFWTRFIGTRYSKRRGCTQFWAWLLIGVGVLLWLGISLSSLQLNEVLHLDAFTVEHVQITEDYAYLHFLEEVDFHLTYTIETPDSRSTVDTNSSYFNALLLNEYEYAHYVDGEPFQYIEAGSKFRTTYAYLPHTYIDNTIKETMYFVVQPCFLERNPTVDYCNTTQLPTSVYSSEKIYNLDQKKKMKKKETWEHFNVTYMSVNPMPVACSSSGWLGGAYLLLFLPYLIITLFGLRVFQMISHCETYRENIERIYTRELNVPENEVDYWQPMPWDPGKAVFKELFKLIFRQRRKYFRVQAAGGDLSGFSFRLSFLLQVLVVVLLTLAQAPIFYIWARRSCLFLKQFIYYGVLSAILRMSLMGVAQDFVWYIIIQTWGWKDLCPHCTERIKHCDCFNDEILILAVERVGPKWELIRVLDGIMAKQNNYEAQFESYTTDQLRERWDVIVGRAEKHMDKVEKLRAYQEKKRLEALRRDRSQSSFTTMLSRRRVSKADVINEADHNQPASSTVDNTENSSADAYNTSSESDIHLCNLREKKDPATE